MRRTSRRIHRNSPATTAPWRVRDTQTGWRGYFDTRAKAEAFVIDVDTDEKTGKPLRWWAKRLVVEQNVPAKRASRRIHRNSRRRTSRFR